MYSSGTTAIATSGTGNVTLVTVPAGGSFNRLLIINEGANAGFFSVDGGSTWGRIPAAAAATSPVQIEWFGRSNQSVLMKRAGSTDMGGVYAFADECKM